ncbi:hypothetical protein Tco_0915558 [Tanacetum coccineum]
MNNASFPKDESIDSAFARFNTIITSLKALDEGYSSKSYVRKFLRALHPKWRAKVTTIEESKDLTSLSLDELIGNLKVSEIVKAKGERRSLAARHVGKRLQEVLKLRGRFVRQQVGTIKDLSRSRGDKNGKSEGRAFDAAIQIILIENVQSQPEETKNQEHSCWRF